MAPPTQCAGGSKFQFRSYFWCQITWLMLHDHKMFSKIRKFYHSRKKVQAEPFAGWILGFWLVNDWKRPKGNDNTDHEVILSGSVTLDCKVSGGVPIPQIKWYKFGEPLRPNLKLEYSHTCSLEITHSWNWLIKVRNWPFKRHRSTVEIRYIFYYFKNLRFLTILKYAIFDEFKIGDIWHF